MNYFHVSISQFIFYFFLHYIPFFILIIPSVDLSSVRWGHPCISIVTGLWESKVSSKPLVFMPSFRISRPFRRPLYLNSGFLKPNIDLNVVHKHLWFVSYLLLENKRYRTYWSAPIPIGIGPRNSLPSLFLRPQIFMLIKSINN